MLVVGVLNGFSGSVKKHSSRTSGVVLALLRDEYKAHYIWRADRSSFLGLGAGRLREFVQEHNAKENSLLLVGKSFGAKNLIDHVVEPLWKNVMLYYKQLFLFTIDPCWPSPTNWSPNRNAEVLKVRAHLTLGRNIQVLAPTNEMGGARVEGPAMENIEVHWPEADHFSIVQRPIVKETLRGLLRRVSR